MAVVDEGHRLSPIVSSKKHRALLIMAVGRARHATASRRSAAGSAL